MAIDGPVPATHPGKIPLRQLLGHLSVGEFWTLLGTAVLLLGGSFKLGEWYRGKEAALELSRADIESAKKVGQAEADAGEYKGKLTAAEELTRALKAKSEFFSNCALYYRTKDRDHAEARKMFVDFYRRLAARGNDLKANGYLIDTGGSTGAPKDCRIVFADSPIPYDVPKDVKGAAIMNSFDLN